MRAAKRRPYISESCRGEVSSPLIIIRAIRFFRVIRVPHPAL
jgi:hypothetical protein